MKHIAIETSQPMSAPRQEVASAIGGPVLNLSEIYITPDTPPEIMEQAARQLAERGGSWEFRGLCGLADPDLFNPPKTTNNVAAPAKKICVPCVVQEECLEDAFRWNDMQAVRGGTSGSERRAILKKRKAAKKAQHSEESDAQTTAATEAGSESQ